MDGAGGISALAQVQLRCDRVLVCLSYAIAGWKVEIWAISIIEVSSYMSVLCL